MEMLMFSLPLDTNFEPNPGFNSSNSMFSIKCVRRYESEFPHQLGKEIKEEFMSEWSRFIALTKDKAELKRKKLKDHYEKVKEQSKIDKIEASRSGKSKK